MKFSKKSAGGVRRFGQSSVHSSSGISCLTQGAMIAALYVLLTFAANALGLANYAVQIRFSEALTILPFFTPAAVWGLAAGCVLANLLTGCMLPDIILGGLATLAGACGTYALRRYKWLAPVPPILANTLTVPFLLAYVYRFEGSLPYFTLTVGAGELVSCGVLGMLLLNTLLKFQRQIPWYSSKKTNVRCK